MAGRIRNFDWALTPLGPIVEWSERLKTIVDLMLGSPSMMSLVWGPDAIHLYNDAFTELLQEHRTLALGRSAFETFARSRDVFEADVAAGMAGKSARLLGQRYPVLRNGHLEEAWFDVDYAPVRDETGAVAGVLWTLRETTAQHVAEQALRASEMRHRHLIESWAQAVWETDANGVVITDSPSWRAYTGQSQEEWFGYGWLDAIHPDDRAYAERQWREAIAVRGLVDAEFRLRAPKGGWRWTNVRAAPVLDAGGAIERWAGVNIDIDARKRAEAALRESEEKYRSLFEMMGTGFVMNELVRDEDGKAIDSRYLDLNPAVEKLVGWKASDTVGRLMSEKITAAETAKWVADFEAVISSGTTRQSEHYHESLGMWFRASASPIGGDRVALVYQNNTAEKLAELARRESEERQAFLLKLSDALRLSADPADIQGETTRLLREQLSAGWCYYVDWDLDRKTGLVLRDRVREGLSSLAGAHDVSDASEFLGLLDGGAVLTVRDYASHEQLPIGIRQKFTALGFRSMMVAPLFGGGRLIASLLVGDTDIREWSPSEASLLVEVAERTWSAIERGRAESALRESEGRLHLALEATALAVYEWDLVTDRLTTNERFRELVGIPAGAPVIGANVMEDCVHRDDRARVDPDLARAMDVSGDGKFVFEHRLTRIEPLGHPWVLSHGQVYFDGPAGARQPVRVFGTLQEITARKQSETALREIEEKYRTLYTQMGQGYIEIELIRGPGGNAVDYRYVVLNPAYERLTGIPIDKALGRPSLEVIPDLSSFWAETFQRIVDNHTAEEFEYEEKALDRWFGIFAYPADGDRLTVLALDITQRKKAEAALRDSEERFQQFANASAAGLWMRDAGTLAMEFASPAIGTIYGVAAHALLGDITRWASMIVPEDRDAALNHLEAARAGETAVHEFRIQRSSDGAFRWIRNTDFPLRDNGGITRIGGIAQDVTEAKLAAEHSAVLLAELQHRVRNIMALLRSITDRTAERAESVQDYRDLMMGRLLAFARVQALLTRTANVSVGVAEIVRDEVSVQVRDEGQYVLDGPDVTLSPKAAEVLTLAIHELATNAVKYGALSVPTGRVTVRWSTVEKPGGPWLVFDWTEEGGPPHPAPDPAAPRPRGFGSELIEERIPYELRGRGQVTIEPGGARCHLEFPLLGGASILETGAPRRATVFGGAIDMTGELDLTGRHVLVVEDDYYLATDAARALRGAGADVMGPCATEADARAEMGKRRPDAGVVDINLGSGPSFKLAQALKDRGIPFVFTTGYDAEVIAAEFEGVERLEKPLQLRQIVGAVARLTTTA